MSGIQLYAENIAANLFIPSQTQGFTFTTAINQYQIINNFIPTSFVSSQNALEFINANDAGYRLRQLTANATALGNLILESFTMGNLPGMPILTFNENGPLVVSLTGNNAFQLKNNTNVTPLEFYNASGTNYVAFQAGSLNTNTTWTLPLTDSTGTQALVSNGTGTLSWSDILSGDAPADATYIIQTSNAFLPNAQVLASLTNGIVKNTTTTGVLSIAAAGVDYYSPGYPTTLIDDFNLNGAPIDSYGNVGVGTLALFSLILNSSTNTLNTAIGSQALYAFTTGTDNTAIGQSALFSFVSGSDNTAVGLGSGYYMTSGDQNCIFGSDALPNVTSGSSRNSVFGFNAAQNQNNYNSCLFLGARADASVDNLTNATAIGADAVVGASNCMVLGSGVNVGIGTSSPSYLLDVVGTARANKLIGNDNAPTVVLGSAAGTSPSSTIVGSELGGTFSVTVGVGATNGLIGTFTLITAMPSSTFSVIFTAANVATGSILKWEVATSSNTFTLNAITGLVATTTYQWNYQIVGY